MTTICRMTTAVCCHLSWVAPHPAARRFHSISGGLVPLSEVTRYRCGRDVLPAYRTELSVIAQHLSESVQRACKLTLIVGV